MNHPKPRGGPLAGHFSPLRLFLTGVAGTLGMVIGCVGGLFIDDALGSPMGRSNGFLPMGYLGLDLLVVGMPLGAVFGAGALHKWLGGRGSFWASLIAVLLAVGLVALPSLVYRGLALQTLVLLPIAAAVGLEIDHVRSK